MNGKLKHYLDNIFEPFKDNKQVSEIKEELFSDLSEKLKDLKDEGFSEDEAFNKTVLSIGDISEIIEGINSKTRELQLKIGLDFSLSDLKNSDFRNVKVHSGKFNYSNLEGSDFSNSDLSGSSFKCSNLKDCNFNNSNLSNAKINKSNCQGASFKGTNLDYTDFSLSELGGVSFDGLKMIGTNFRYSGLKGASFRSAVLINVSIKSELNRTIFENTSMDKLTYALLKGFKADLKNVRLIDV